MVIIKNLWQGLHLMPYIFVDTPRLFSGAETLALTWTKTGTGRDQGDIGRTLILLVFMHVSILTHTDTQTACTRAKLPAKDLNTHTLTNIEVICGLDGQE